MNYLKALMHYRNEILFLSFQNVKTQYLETAFGMGWAVVKPMVYVSTYWLFFTIGLRGGNPVDGHLFILFLFAGSMPWFLISSLITSSTKSITQNKLLVKTIKFPVMALPLIMVLSEIYVHIAVMFLVFIVYAINGYFPDIYYLNFIYYWFTLVTFFTALSFLLSSVSVLIRDVQNLIAAIIQPMFWVTPVLWYQPGLIDFLERLFNPFYYFLVGYRETLLYDKWFFEDIWYDIYIWVIILLLFIAGIRFWNKIRPIMSDLL